MGMEQAECFRTQIHSRLPVPHTLPRILLNSKTVASLSGRREKVRGTRHCLSPLSVSATKRSGRLEAAVSEV